MSIHRRYLICGDVFHARLTADEANEMERLLAESPEWRALHIAEARRDASVNSGDFDAIYIDVVIERQKDVFNVIRDWYERVVRPRLEADPLENWGVRTRTAPSHDGRDDARSPDRSGVPRTDAG